MSIEGGLQKMFEAKADVNKMKAELAVKNQELAVAAKEAEALLKQVRVCVCVCDKEPWEPLHWVWWWHTPAQQSASITIDISIRL